MPHLKVTAKYPFRLPFLLPLRSDMTSPSIFVTLMVSPALRPARRLLTYAENSKTGTTSMGRSKCLIWIFVTMWTKTKP